MRCSAHGELALLCQLRPAGGSDPAGGRLRACGRALAADAKFCAVCGKPVTQAKESDAAAVEPRAELLEALPTAHERWEQ